MSSSEKKLKEMARIARISVAARDQNQNQNQSQSQSQNQNQKLDGNTDSESTMEATQQNRTSSNGNSSTGLSLNTFSLISSLVTSWKPSSQSIPEAGNPNDERNNERVQTNYYHQDSAHNRNLNGKNLDPNAPVSLEGTLSFRKCKTSLGSRQWKQVYVVLNLTDGGSIACYKHKPTDRTSQSKLASSPEANKKKSQHTGAKRRTSALLQDTIISSQTDVLPRLHLPSYMNWQAKDIKNNTSSFVIEISSDDPVIPFSQLNSVNMEQAVNKFAATTSSESMLFQSDRMMVPEELQEDVERARDKGQAFRIYFKCTRSGNEKVLWLRALEQVNRLSFELHRQRGIKAAFGSPTMQISHSRIRSTMAQRFALEGRVLDDKQTLSSNMDDPGTHLRERIKGVGSDEKEYLVYPVHAYPNRWMTDSEMYTEMLKPSETFHDLRVSNATQKEIGTLKVELLQCVGLPALDFASETDAVAYFVCGSYVFTSDVIWNRLNPLWLPRSRRACVFPLYHAYARLFVGIFDDDGKAEKDDFAGRVCLDLARFRPRSTYDVTLPLRLSSHVYSRRPRGALRIRFSIEWKSEREALLSYLPKKMPRPMSGRAADDVTVLCADEKAFRNIVTTVHGIHMPDRFSFSQLRATMREANFARKVVTNSIRDTIIDMIKWENPALSALVFCVWIHCVYRNAFSLVPLYGVISLLVTMARTYVLYGSDGPIQNGFIPPSFEEMFHALLRGGDTHVIEPLKVKPKRLQRKLTFKSARMTVESKPETHKQRGKWLFRLLGLKNELKDDAAPEDYHMEFPYSQGLQNPYTKETHYPRFSVQESMVSKSNRIKAMSKKRGNEDEGDNMLGELMNPAARQPRKKLSLDMLHMNMGGKKRENNVRRRSFPALRMEKAASARSMSLQDATKKTDERVIRYEDLPSRLRIPEQNADAKAVGPARKKKIVDELAELRDNMHKLTFNMFHDRTHVVRRPDATYFGYRPKNLDNELERLLNIGQYSSANPLVARLGLYIEPIISAAHSFICASRAVYNVITWRDPILSFWVSLVFAASAIVLVIFPWRLFFFVTGLLVFGPQNWMLRVMDERGTTPDSIKAFWEKRKKKPEERKKKKIRVFGDIPKDQPIVSCHSSDNHPPPELALDDVNQRDIHEVSVPYSQLMYQRMYDWPPEPQYSKCEPTLELEDTTSSWDLSRTQKGSNSKQ